MRSILHPKPRDSEEERSQERRFERHSTIDALDDTFELFLAEIGRDFIDVLDETLRLTLQTEEDKNRIIHYESVDNQTPIQNLNYDETNSGKRKHIIYTYLTKAAEQWVFEEPADPERKQLIEEYLDDDDHNFRRLGLYLLSNHPDVDLERTEAELLNEENYYEDTINFEFYRLLEQGFRHLTTENQNQVGEILRNGPRNRELVQDRAKRLAESDDDSPEEIERRIMEKWQSQRLYLVRDHLSEEHREYTENLIEKHGKPENLPTEGFSSDVRSGFIAQKGPAELKELRNRSAKKILELCIEWEPPEQEDWETTDSGGLKERSYHGFADQLEKLIKERPEEFASELLILRDAKPQYSNIALKTFREIVEDGGAFPWEVVLELCEYIVDRPEQWSSRCRFDIATLLYNGIVSDSSGLPDDHEQWVKSLLLELADETGVDPEEQPPGWIGGVGTSEEEVRQRGLEALITYAVWRDNEREEPALEDEVRDAVVKKITLDTSLPVRSALGRCFGKLWAIDEDLTKKHLEGIFPTGGSSEEKDRFVQAFNGYIRSTNCYEPAFEELRPYYIHAIELLTGDKEEGIHSDALASHAVTAYIFGNEDLEDEDSLISIFYARATPDLAQTIAWSLASGLDNGDNLVGHWDAIRQLWQWRLDTVEKTVQDSGEASEYQQEFQRFLKCLRGTPEAEIVEEQELVERSVGYTVHDTIGIHTFEEWLAKQSEEYPESTIEIYQQLVAAASPEEWPEIVRTSREELRVQLYENAVKCGEAPAEIAFRIADQFAAEGREMDRKFLNEHLGDR
jgi:hypothetical protein